MSKLPDHIHGDPNRYHFLIGRDKWIIVDRDSQGWRMDYFSGERRHFTPEEESEFCKSYAGPYWESYKNIILEGVGYIIENLHLKYSYFDYTVLFEVPVSFSKKKPKTKIGITVVAYRKDDSIQLLCPMFCGPIIEPENIPLVKKLGIRLGNSTATFSVKAKNENLPELIRDINDHFADAEYTEISEQFDQFSGLMLLHKREELRATFSKKALFYLHNYDNWDLILKETDELLKRGNPLGEFMQLIKQISVIKNRLQEMVKTK